MKGGSLLGRVVATLSATEVPFMLTGSVAAAYHGAPRATVDLDFVIAAAPAQLRRIVDEFLRDGLDASEDAALEAHASGGMFNVIDSVSGWKVEWAHRGGSRRQIEDVATLIRVRRGDIDQAYVDRWVTELGVEAEWTEVAQVLDRDG